MAFDISTRRASETAEIELKNGDGTPLKDDEGNAIGVVIHGPGSKTYRQAEAERSRKRAKRVRESGGKLESAMDDAADDQIAFLSAITVKFTGDVSHPDAEKKADLARAIYADDSLGFIRDQVSAEANDWSAFTKGSAKG